MVFVCPAPDSGSDFIVSAMNSLDCQAQNLGSSGYQALANPTSAASLVLASLVTIFVAIIGIRMIRGHALNFSDLIGWGIKLGIAMALASSWAVYRIVAYDVVVKGPGELANIIGNASSLPGTDGSLTVRMQNADNAMKALIAVGTGALEPLSRAEQAKPNARVQGPFEEGMSLGLARTVFVSSLLASQGFTRLLGGILLALAPIFSGLLLFEATRTFFFGWVRALVATALGTLFTALILAAELAVLEPWLVDVLAQRSARFATPSAPFELLAIALAFITILIGAVFLSVRIAFSSRIVQIVHRQISLLKERVSGDKLHAVESTRMTTDNEKLEQHYSRASKVAQAVQNDRRQEIAFRTTEQSTSDSLIRSQIGYRTDSGMVMDIQVPLGQSYKRTSRRVSQANTSRNSAI